MKLSDTVVHKMLKVTKVDRILFSQLMMLSCILSNRKVNMDI